MNDINEAIDRICQLYNDNQTLNIQGVAGHYIEYSPTNDIYQNTCASFVNGLKFTGTGARMVVNSVVSANPPYFGFDDDDEAVGFASVENDEDGGNFPILETAVTVERLEPILKIRTVFTGSMALQNSALHYDRVRAMLSVYDDMSLIGNTTFANASLFFEGRWLIRYQSDATYLTYLDIYKNEPYLDSIDELLKAFPNNQFIPGELLTQREIQGVLNG